MLEFNCREKKPIFGLEIPVEITENYSPVLKAFWGEDLEDTLNLFKKAQSVAKDFGADFLSLYFNALEPADSEKDKLKIKYKNILQEVLGVCKMPLMIKLSAHANWDIELANSLFEVLDREIIISPVQSANYKELILAAKKTPYSHKFVMRTPIDINLTKELNIISIDEGVKPCDILIDPDMGCIGYGIDYGYSIIERICLAREAGDKMLDMPVVVYAGEEAYKAKETKSTDFSSGWGELCERAKMWEISTASALISAGANVVVCWHPEVIKILKNQFCEVPQCL